MSHRHPPPRRLSRRLAIGLPIATAAGAAALTIGSDRAVSQRPHPQESPPHRRRLPGRPELGVYVGNEPQRVISFERWLGRRVDGVLGYIGDARWEEIAIPTWPIDLWRQIDRPVYWSVPLIPVTDRGALAQAAGGAYDHHWRSAARHLAAWRPQDRHIHIRTGWEFDGDWFPWAAKGKEQAFIGAFRRFVDIFRAASPRFLFEWNCGYSGEMDPELAWPGTDWVDVVGMDFYWHLQWNSHDPVRAWESIRDRRRGLRWHQDFAGAQNRPTAYSEWGVTTNNAAPFLELAHAWFNAHDVLFHSYWDTDSAYPGRLSNGSRARSGAAFTRLFGRTG